MKAFDWTPMRISFVRDRADVSELCEQLRLHGAVYSPGTQPIFQAVADVMRARGVAVMMLGARTQGAVANFLVRGDLAGDIYAVEDRVATAFGDWQYKGQPIPHVETLSTRGGFPVRERPRVAFDPWADQLAQLAV